MIEFKLKSNKSVKILKNGKEVGEIFTPSGSGHDVVDGVQICGFSEAFDFWGCGNYEGFKDIQVLFSGQRLKGKHTRASFGECVRCYMNPCACEVKRTLPNKDEKVGKWVERVDEEKEATSNPFKVKRMHEVAANQI